MRNKHCRVYLRLCSVILAVVMSSYNILSYSTNQDMNNSDFDEGKEHSVVNQPKDTASDRVYKLHGNRKLILKVPDQWRQVFGLPPGGEPPWPTIVFGPPEGKDYEVRVSIIIIEDKEKLKNSHESTFRIAEEAKNMVIKTAKEQDVKLNKIDNNSVFGYYFSITDKKPQLPPGEYRYLTQAAIALEDLSIICSIFTQEENSIVVKQTLNMLANAQYERLDPDSLAAEEFSLTFPGESWSLVVDLSDFRMIPNQMSEDGLGMKASGYNEELGLMITIFIEKKEFEGNALKYREYYLKMDKKSPLIKTETKLYERGELAVYEYFVPTYQGDTINQRHFNAILTHEDKWIDVHMSKVEFKQEDWKYFEKVLQSIRIRE